MTKADLVTLWMNFDAVLYVCIFHYFKKVSVIHFYTYQYLKRPSMIFFAKFFFTVRACMSTQKCFNYLCLSQIFVIFRKNLSMPSMLTMFFFYFENFSINFAYLSISKGKQRSF
jgi:hypothetical protein